VPPELGLNSWTTGDAASAVDDIRAAAAAGCRWVELRDAKVERHLAEHGSLDALRDEAAARGIAVLDVHTLDDATLAPDLAARLARLDTLASWAAALGARFVTVGPSYGRDLPRAELLSRTTAALARLAAVAARHKVRIGFEYHGYARCSINRLDDALAVLDALGDPQVGLVIDAFHFHVGGSSAAQLAAVDPRRILAVHLADVDHDDWPKLGKDNRVMPGDGVLPLAAFAGALAAAGYAGPYTVELFRQEYWSTNPVLVAQRSVAAMRRFV